MKTKNNVQKTTFSLTVLFAGLFLTIAVFASGNDSEYVPEGLSATLIENALDPRLEIENWMINDGIFSESAMMTVANEKPMEIEPWMVDEEVFSNSEYAVAPSADKKMMIEDWMIENNNW